MGINSQLAYKARMRWKAMLEAIRMKEYEEFVNTDFLEWVKWIWPSTKAILINNNITTYETLRKLTRVDLEKMDITLPSISAILRFIDEQEKKFKELEILNKETSALEWTAEEKAEELILDEDFNA